MSKDDKSIKKSLPAPVGEPSRWQAQTPGHTPTFASKKLRRLAASGMGEMHAHQLAVQKLMRTEKPNRTGTQPRHVVMVDDVTRGLGIEYGRAQQIQRLVSQTSAQFTQKTQTQRLMHARGHLLSTLRDSMKDIPADTRDEVLRRATAYWKRTQQTDYGKEPTVRLTIPLEKGQARGGDYYRRVWQGTRWRYYYSKEAYERAHGKDSHLHGPEQLSLFESTKKQKQGEKQRQKTVQKRPKPKPAQKKPTEKPTATAKPAKRQQSQTAAEAPQTPELPEPSAKVTPDALGAEALAVAQSMGIKEGVGATKGAQHAILGQAITVLVRSKQAKAGALDAGRKLKAALAQRWFVGGAKLQDVRFGQGMGGRGYHDGYTYKITVWPDVPPDFTWEQPTLREDAGRETPTGSTAKGVAVAERVAALVGEHARSNALAAVARLIESGDALAIQGAKMRLKEAHRQTKVQLKELNKIPVPVSATATQYGVRNFPDHPRHQEWRDAERSEAVLREAVNALQKATNKAPAKNLERKAPAEPKHVVPTKQAPQRSPREIFSAKTHELLEMAHSGGPNALAADAEIRRRIEQRKAKDKRPIKAFIGYKGPKAVEEPTQAPVEAAQEPVRPEPEPATTEEPVVAPTPAEEPPEPKLVVPTATSQEGIRAAIAVRVRERFESMWAERAKKRKVVEFGADAPPGGWSEADKVPQPSDAERERRIRAVQEARIQQETLREIAKHSVFEKDSVIKINGKDWRVAGDPKVTGSIRRVLITPLSKRAKQPKELWIYRDGNAEMMTLRGTRTEVRSIEGQTLQAEPHEFHTEEYKQRQDAEQQARREQHRKEAEERRQQAERERREKLEAQLRDAERKQQESKTSGKAKTPKESPRGQAKEASKRMRQPAGAGDDDPTQESSDGELPKKGYTNARKSKLRHLGEDLAGSARHRALEWSGLQQALASDRADEMFTRKFLAKSDPISLMHRVQDGSAAPVSALLAHFMVGKFPPKPDKLRRYSDEQSREGYHAAWKHFQKVLNEVDLSAGPETVFKEVFEKISPAAAQQRRGPVSILETMQADKNTPEVDRVRNHYLQKLASQLHGKKRSGWRVELKKTSPLGRMQEFMTRAKEAYGEDTDALRKNVQGHVLDIMEGKSIAKTFGQSAKKQGFTLDPDGAYTAVMARSGPKSEYASIPQAESILDKGGKFAMRGLQYGKSMPDDERAHHLKSCMDSFNDLSDVLGLPSSMVGFNGKLGLGLGARGRGKARAHYEPDGPGGKVINLTRKKGAGSLAHEWGHFLDHAISQADGGREWLSNSAVGGSATRLAVQVLMTSPVMGSFKARVTEIAKSSETDKKKQQNAVGYWTSNPEMFARCFERYVQHKLHKAGRENTYLVAYRKAGGGASKLWPTDAEVAQMEPMFDRVFAALRNDPELMAKAFGAPLIAPEYQRLIKGKLVVRRP